MKPQLEDFSPETSGVYDESLKGVYGEHYLEPARELKCQYDMVFEMHA